MVMRITYLRTRCFPWDAAKHYGCQENSLFVIRATRAPVNGLWEFSIL